MVSFLSVFLELTARHDLLPKMGSSTHLIWPTASEFLIWIISFLTDLMSQSLTLESREAVARMSLSNGCQRPFVTSF